MSNNTPTTNNKHNQTKTETFNFLIEDHQYLTYIKKILRHRARQAGIKRISTPLIEDINLYKKAYDTDSHIPKQFLTCNNEKHVIRAENVISIAKSYITQKMQYKPQPVQYYYIESFIKKLNHKNQQYYRCGVQIMGELDPSLDAQLIYMLYTILQDLEIAKYTDLHINSIGCHNCRKKYLEELDNYYFDKVRSMCPDCKTNITKNPLKVITCQNEDCKILASMAPKISDYICQECTTYHQLVKNYLDELNIKYSENPHLVRDYSFCTRTVFNFHTKEDNQIIGLGSHYDELTSKISDLEVPIVGFSFEANKLITLLKQYKINVPYKDNIHVFVVQLGPNAKKKCLPLLYKLRDQGIKTMSSTGKGSIKSQLEMANKFNAPYCLILGEQEVRDKTIILRDMHAGKQTIVPSNKIIEELIKKIGTTKLDMHNFK